MLKLIIILTLVFYSIYKLGSIFFRAGISSQARKRADGNVHVNQPRGNKANGGNIKGGEYIDYEEVK